jgi:DNA-binding MarR family transcriptional regulator
MQGGKTNRIEKDPYESTMLELVRASDRLSRGPAAVLKEDDLSGAQYNVLRILRGAPEGANCGEIANRMITRDPDITRLLDRLEKRGLIQRNREGCDRRTVVVRVTDEGLALLARLDEPIRRVHYEQLGHLSEQQLKDLNELVAACCERLA